MLKRCFTVAWIPSLVLFVVLALFTALSFTMGGVTLFKMGKFYSPHEFNIHALKGSFIIIDRHVYEAVPVDEPLEYVSGTTIGGGKGWTYIRAVLGSHGRKVGRETSVVLDAYWPLILTAILPVIGLILIWRRRRRQRRRLSANCCQNCGYALTGNVSGICPECGTVTAST